MWLSSPLWRTELPDLDPQVGAIWPLGQVHMLGLEQKPSPQGLRQIAENSKNIDWRHLLICLTFTDVNKHAGTGDILTVLHISCALLFLICTLTCLLNPSQKTKVCRFSLQVFPWDRLAVHRGTCQLSYSGNIGLIGLMPLHDAHITGMRPNSYYYRNVLVKCGQREVRRSERLWAIVAEIH